jgi:hypothetical protein
MIRALSIASSLTLALGATGAQTVDETKLYGRACVTVVDSKTKNETLERAMFNAGEERSTYADAF